MHAHAQAHAHQKGGTHRHARTCVHACAHAHAVVRRAFMQALHGFDDEFIEFMEQEQQEALPLQEREVL